MHRSSNVSISSLTQFIHLLVCLFIYLFMMAAVLMGVRWSLTVAGMCISLTTSEVKHPFLCLVVICTSSLGNVYSSPLAHLQPPRQPWHGRRLLPSHRLSPAAPQPSCCVFSVHISGSRSSTIFRILCCLPRSPLLHTLLLQEISSPLRLLLSAEHCLYSNGPSI